jgi:hypothetical protein
MYNPSMGVWTIRDPVQQGLNLYENVKSNPANLTDPMGLYVTASLRGSDIVMEVGITLWSPWEPSVSDYFLRNVKENIQRGLRLLEQNNPYKIFHLRTKNVYPVRWIPNVHITYDKHSISKPGNQHYVVVRDNKYILGLTGGQNAFSPSISPENNQRGWGAWSYEMGGSASEYNSWWAAHEVMHFAGLNDEYSWITGAPNAKYVGTNKSGQPILTNIMAGNGGMVTNVRSYALDQEQVERILTTRLKEALGWTYKVDYTIIK